MCCLLSRGGKATAFDYDYNDWGESDRVMEDNDWAVDEDDAYADEYYADRIMQHVHPVHRRHEDNDYFDY